MIDSLAAWNGLPLRPASPRNSRAASF